MASAPYPDSPTSRPRSVTLVTLGILVFGVVNILRAIGLNRQSELQLELGVSVDPRLRMVLAIFWAIFFFTMAIALWLRRPFVRFVIPMMLVVYALFRVALTVLFAESDYARAGLPLTGIIYSVMVLTAIWALNRQSARNYLAPVEEE